MVISVLISAFVFPSVGKMCDTYSPAITMTISFFLRAVTTLMFYNTTDPDSLMALVSCVTMIIGTIAENISVDSIFNKIIPKETRGILNGAYSFSGLMGTLIYSLIAGILFDKINSYAPFVLVGSLDFIFGVALLILS
mmetsp:Transcript_14078/g.21945  ORF Transcript_14078/g.21945 Transcript_14078/m.21945 type:complete len:138 (-) Transcript_14078:121-534(-)